MTPTVVPLALALLDTPTTLPEDRAPLEPRPFASQPVRRRSTATRVLTTLAIVRGAITTGLVVSGYVLHSRDLYYELRSDSSSMIPPVWAYLGYVGGMHSHGLTVGFAGGAGALAGRDDRLGGLVLDRERSRRRMAIGATMLVAGTVLHAVAPLVQSASCPIVESDDELPGLRSCVRLATGFAITMALTGTATASAGAALLGHARHATPRVSGGLGVSQHGGTASLSLRF